MFRKKVFGALVFYILSANYVYANELNGQIFLNEELFANATVNLLLVGTGKVSSTTTTASGEYSFNNVSAGNYRIQVVGSGVTSAVSKTTISDSDKGHNIWFIEPSAAVSGAGYELFKTVAENESPPNPPRAPSLTVDSGTGFTVSGKISNPGGQGIALKLSLRDLKTGDVVDQFTTTDGNYVLVAPGPSEYGLSYTNNAVRGVSLTPLNQRPSMFGTFLNFVATSNVVKNYTIPLLHLSATVMDINGSPIPGFEMHMTSQNNVSTAYNFQSIANLPQVSNQFGDMTIPFPYAANNYHLRSASVADLNLKVQGNRLEAGRHIDVIYLNSVELSDSDGDGIPNYYEAIYAPFYGAMNSTTDYDQDGVSDLDEFLRATSHTVADTDYDGINDNVDEFPRLTVGVSPYDLEKDSDSDTYPDWLEAVAGTSQNDALQTPIPYSSAAIVDPALRACLDDKVHESQSESDRNRPISYMTQISRLFCNSSLINTLEGIGTFSRLKTLYLRLNPSTVIATQELSGMTDMTSISFSDGSRLDSIDFLDNMPQMNYFTATLSGVTDFTPLYSLPNLLTFRVSEPSEGLALDFLAHLPLLTQLGLTSTPYLEDQLFKIRNASGLISLTLDNVTARNLGFLAGLDQLKWLTLSNLPSVIANLNVLSNLQNLESLLLDNLNISDSSSLSSLSSLQDFSSLYISDIDFSSLKMLRGLESLNRLSLISNNLKSIVSLEQMTWLTYISLRGNNALTCLNGDYTFTSVDEIPSDCFLPDNDEDGITDSIDIDDDNDGMPDEFENTHGFDSLDPSDASGDLDEDGLSNLDEYLQATNPANRDSDSDGVWDGFDSQPNNDQVGKTAFLDVNANDQQDLLMQNSTEGTLYIQDSEVWFMNEYGPELPTWFTLEQAISVPDSNGDASWDFVTLGQTTAGSKLWMLYDSQTGGRLHLNRYPQWLTPAAQKSAIWIEDINNNTFEELVLLVETANGRDALMVYDLNSRSLIKAILLPGWFNGDTVLSVSDWTSNGAAELIVFGKTSGESDIWLKYDSLSGASLGQGRYPGWFIPKQVLVGADIDGNGTESLITLGETTSGANLWMAQDARSGVVRRTHGYPGWLVPKYLATMDDPFGDGRADVVGLLQTTVGAWIWRRTDVMTRTTQSQRGYPDWFTPQLLMTVKDISGDSVEDVFTFGQNLDFKNVLLRQDGITGEDFRLLLLPDDLTPEGIQHIQ